MVQLKMHVIDKTMIKPKTKNIKELRK